MYSCSTAGFGGTTAPPAGSDSAAGTALLTRYFPESAANPTIPIFTFSQPVWTDPQVLARAASEMKASSLFSQVSGPLNPAGTVLPPAAYARLHATLGPARALPPIPPPGSTVPAAEYQAYRASANFISAVSNSDLTRIVPIAIVAIGILLALVLRSLVAPLYPIASVGLSYLAALGLCVLLFIKLGGSDGIVFFLPFLMFIFLLALGEDYNILVMTRIREEAHKLPLREAVTRAIAHTKNPGECSRGRGCHPPLPRLRHAASRSRPPRSPEPQLPPRPRPDQAGQGQPAGHRARQRDPGAHGGMPGQLRTPDRQQLQHSQHGSILIGKPQLTAWGPYWPSTESPVQPSGSWAQT